MEARSALLLALFVSLCRPAGDLRADLTRFLVPAVPEAWTLQDLAGGRVRIEWNVAGSVPTVLAIFPEERVTIFPPVPTFEEAKARTADFVDAHPELFAVRSADLQPMRGGPIGSTAWVVNCAQHHEGVAVMGARFGLYVRKDGELVYITARLFPEADLAALDVDPASGEDEAVEIAVSAYGTGNVSGEPELRIAFRSFEAFLAWIVWMEYPGSAVKDGVVPSRSLLIGIDADTGEILGIQDMVFHMSIPVFIRGDANGDGRVDLADPIHTLSHLFGSADRVACPDAYDVNDDGALDLADPIYAVRFLFSGGEPPPAPFPGPGPDPTPDELPPL